MTSAPFAGLSVQPLVLLVLIKEHAVLSGLEGNVGEVTYVFICAVVHGEVHTP